MTCAEWRTRLATLMAAELSALTDSVVMTQDGENRLQRRVPPFPELKAAIREAQAEVDRCDGCRRRMFIPGIPLDC